MLLTTLIIATLSGCSQAPVEVPLPEKPEPPVAIVSTRNLDVDIYLDGTLSMYGFADSAVTTAYVNLISALPGAATAVSGNTGSVRYHCFGDRIAAITQSEFNSATGQKFYRNNPNNRVTNLTQVVEKIAQEQNTPEHPISAGRVAVAITDLYVDQANIDPLLQVIRDQFAGSGYSVGLVGIRSYYRGQVYDIGRQAAGKPYTSTVDDPTTYRPFYLLLFGTAGDILRFHGQLTKACLDQLPPATVYFELFSRPSTTGDRVLLGSSRILAANGRLAHIRPDADFAGKNSHPAVQGFKITTRSGNVAENIFSTLGVNAIPGTRLDHWLKSAADGNGGENWLSVQARVEQLADGVFVFDPAATLRLQECTAAPYGGTIGLRTGINPDDLNRGHYRIILQVTGASAALNPVIPPEWNMRDENDPDYGRKTIYLYHLVEGLYGLYGNSTDDLATVYYYLNIVR